MEYDRRRLALIAVLVLSPSLAAAQASDVLRVTSRQRDDLGVWSLTATAGRDRISWRADCRQQVVSVQPESGRSSDDLTPGWSSPEPGSRKRRLLDAACVSRETSQNAGHGDPKARSGSRLDGEVFDASGGEKPPLAPQSTLADASPPSPPLERESKTSGVVVQVGAFASRAVAFSSLAAVKGRVPAAAALRSRVYASPGGLLRAELIAPDRETSFSICAAIQQAGGQCWIHGEGRSR